MKWMEERGRGFPVGGGVVPIVPGAVIFDLAPLGRFAARPTAAMAYDACEHATATPMQGSIGAGTGATVGKIVGADRCSKCGLGLAAADRDALMVRALAVGHALVAVRNARGDI